MLPTQAQTVWILLLAIVPGFLAMSVWSRAKTWRGPRRDLHTVLYSLALSALIQLFLAPVTISWLLPVRQDLENYPGARRCLGYLGCPSGPSCRRDSGREVN